MRITNALLVQYVVDMCFATIAGLIREAYIEGKGPAFITRLEGVVKEYTTGAVRQKWNVFMLHTVPKIKDDADQWLVFQQRIRDTGSVAPPKPASTKRCRK